MSLPRTLYCGPSGWSYPHWNGIVYPKLKARSFHALEDLATYFGELKRRNAYEVYLMGMIPIELPGHLESIQSSYVATHDDWFEPSSELVSYIYNGPRAELQTLIADKLHPGTLDDSTVDITEIARLLNVSVQTVRRLVNRGQIPVMRLGRTLRFTPRDVMTALVGPKR